MLRRSQLRAVSYATWVYTPANVPRCAPRAAMAGVAAQDAAEDVAPLRAATC